MCVERLNRRKTSFHIFILYIYIYVYIYIYIRKPGVTGVPGGSVTNEDTSPGPVKTYRRGYGGAPGRF